MLSHLWRNNRGQGDALDGRTLGSIATHMDVNVFVEALFMQAYRVETTLQQDGTLTLSDLPFHAGEAVEVIILIRSPTALRENRYPLRGTLISYINPTEPVAQEDWEAAPNK